MICRKFPASGRWLDHLLDALLVSATSPSVPFRTAPRAHAPVQDENLATHDSKIESYRVNVYHRPADAEGAFRTGKRLDMLGSGAKIRAWKRVWMSYNVCKLGGASFTTRFSHFQVRRLLVTPFLLITLTVRRWFNARSIFSSAGQCRLLGKNSLWYGISFCPANLRRRLLY